jgi:hypothetical protein
MDVVCDMCGGQMHTRTDCGGYMKDRDWLANVSVDGLITLKRINRMAGRGLDLSGSG